MYPRKLILKNFGSFASLDYDFVNQAIAVIGENRTQDDQLSNGSGKTIVGQGLFYGIYGINLRGVLDKKLIREGEDSAYICVQIHCPIRKQILSIEREIRMKSSSTLKLTLMNEDEKEVTLVPFSTVNDGNKFVANWIEISAEDAKSYYIISKGNYKSFFNSSNTEKLALISRFINFTSVDKTKDIIIEKIEELNESKQALVKNRALNEGKVSAYEEQLESLLNKDVKQERENEIAEITKQIDLFDQEIENVRESVTEYKKTITVKEQQKQELVELKTSVENELKEFDTDSFQETYNEINKDLETYREDKNKQENDLDKVTVRIRTIKSTLNTIEAKLAGVIVCPKCHHEFLLKGEEDVSLLKTKKEVSGKDLEKEIKNQSLINQSIKEIDEIIQEYIGLRRETQEEERKILDQQNKVKSKLKALLNNYNEIENDIFRTEKNIQRSEIKIEDLQKSKEVLLKKIDTLKKAPLDKIDTTSLVESIEALRRKNSALDKSLLQIDNEVFNIQQWTTRFKDFKMYLALEQLKNIQSSANDILKKMNSDLRIMIEGFKKGTNGKVKEEITPYVFRDEMESFFYYSGGEQARCEIALILALQTMINTTKQYGGMNFLLIDEVLESADSLGIENIISSMAFLRQPILIVTHVPKLNEEIRQLKIIKENGISRLEE